MENIGNILKNRKIEKSESDRPVNVAYEKAKVISQKTGLNIFHVMKLTKKYGEPKMKRLMSWISDYPNINRERLPGLAMWYLVNK